MLAVSPVLQNPKVWEAEAAGKCEITQAQHNEVYACSFVRQMFRRICRVTLTLQQIVHLYCFQDYVIFFQV